jgi:hypothetical protein
MGAIQRATATQYLDRLLSLGSDSRAGSQLRAQVLFVMQGLDHWLEKQKPGRLDSDWAAHYAQARLKIAAMMNEPSTVTPTRPRSTPPGSPIGN